MQIHNNDSSLERSKSTYLMIQQLWTPKYLYICKWNSYLEQIPTYPCILQQYSQIGKIWNPLSCPLMVEWIKKMCSVENLLHLHLWKIFCIYSFIQIRKWLHISRCFLTLTTTMHTFILWYTFCQEPYAISHSDNSITWQIIPTCPQWQDEARCLTRI